MTMKKLLPAQKLPTRFHGILDYFFAFVMIATPSIGRFANNKAAVVIFILLGMLMVVNSLFTKYEHGPFPTISMKKHLNIDKAVGGLLIVCPWLIGGDGVIMGSVTGLLVIATAFMSEETVPEPEQRNQERNAIRRSSLTKQEYYRLYGRSRGGRR
jgi:hypothetical protein